MIYRKLIKLILPKSWITKIKLIFDIIFGDKSYLYKGFKKYDLIIFDTIFPHPVSGFRLEEFTFLLSEFKNSKILLIPDSYPVVKSSKELHPTHIKEFLEENANLKYKLKPIRGFVNINTKLFYCIFINQIYRYIDILEKYKISFVFTLYPGGGFEINNELCDEKLKRVLSSKMFRKVIVTQKITKDYLLENNFCNEDKIKFIFGCVVPQNSLIKDTSEKMYYNQGKDTLDICFCAAKYMPKGIDKGYDIFIELAHSLLAKYEFIKFHVIGGFDENDINVNKISKNITFYGYQNFDNLQSIFQDIDILISPNKPFLLRSGAFDGFPLGTVVEAALNGVMVMLTDGLQQNVIFVDHEEIIIIDGEIKSIEKVIVHLINDPGTMIQIAQKGKLKFQKIYSNTVQMNPRRELLKNIINQA